MFAILKVREMLWSLLMTDSDLAEESAVKLATEMKSIFNVLAKKLPK